MRRKNAFTSEKSSTPTGLVFETNIAAVLLFWDTNMVDLTSFQKTLYGYLFS